MTTSNSKLPWSQRPASCERCNNPLAGYSRNDIKGINKCPTCGRAYSESYLTEIEMLIGEITYDHLTEIQRSGVAGLLKLALIGVGTLNFWNHLIDEVREDDDRDDEDLQLVIDALEIIIQAAR